MYLIDTHILLWLLSQRDKLSAASRQLLLDSRLFVSVASLWEIAIKQATGKLDLPFTPSRLADICLERDIEILPISPHHLDNLRSLPPIHADPFDRLIICQAIAENIPIITHDSQISRYPVETIW